MIDLTTDFQTLSDEQVARVLAKSTSRDPGASWDPGASQMAWRARGELARRALRKMTSQQRPAGQVSAGPPPAAWARIEKQLAASGCTGGDAERFRTAVGTVAVVAARSAAQSGGLTSLRKAAGDKMASATVEDLTRAALAGGKDGQAALIELGTRWLSGQQGDPAAPAADPAAAPAPAPAPDPAATVAKLAKAAGAFGPTLTRPTMGHVAVAKRAIEVGHAGGSGSDVYKVVERAVSAGRITVPTAAQLQSLMKASLPVAAYQRLYRRAR
jgi:hypothetical protein